MDLQKAMELRQSVRRFKEQDVPKDHIEEILKAATMAPYAENQQKWHFTVIKSQDMKQKIEDIIVAKNGEVSALISTVDEEKGARFQKFCKNFTLFATKAPVLVVISSAGCVPAGYNNVKAANPDSEIAELMLGKRDPGLLSMGGAFQNFNLKAIELGYGTCWVTSANYAAPEIEVLLREETDFKDESYYMVGMMTLGVPDGDLKSPNKKPLEEVCTYVE